MPAKQVGQHTGNAEIEHVIGRGHGALNKEREDDKLEQVGNDSHNHGGSKARTSRDFDGAGLHIDLPFLECAPAPPFYGAKPTASNRLVE